MVLLNKTDGNLGTLTSSVGTSASLNQTNLSTENTTNKTISAVETSGMFGTHLSLTLFSKKSLIAVAAMTALIAIATFTSVTCNQQEIPANQQVKINSQSLNEEHEQLSNLVTECPICPKILEHESTSECKVYSQELCNSGKFPNLYQMVGKGSLEECIEGVDEFSLDDTVSQIADAMGGYNVFCNLPISASGYADTREGWWRNAPDCGFELSPKDFPEGVSIMRGVDSYNRLFIAFKTRDTYILQHSQEVFERGGVETFSQCWKAIPNVWMGHENLWVGSSFLHQYNPIARHSKIDSLAIQTLGRIVKGETVRMPYVEGVIHDKRLA